MARKAQSHVSPQVSFFQERRLPELAALAGYAALIEAYALKVPLPRTLSATGQHHRVYLKDGWRVLTPRHAPPATLEGHLTFALKYEGLDLAVLKRLLLAVGPQQVEAIVRNKPTGTYARRIWFLYEWLLSRELDLPDAKTGAYTGVVDEEQQWATKGHTSSRHRVKDNLPGTPSFCPLFFRTETLEKYARMNLDERARSAVAAVPRDLLARSAHFLLLKDSKSSYAIEGEQPPQDRIQRWARAIEQAGRRAITLNELLRLQKIVIGDARFVKLGLRGEGGFVGEHDRDSRLPLPDHISARPEDLSSLMDGMLAYEPAVLNSIDDVMLAAALSFGFVYIHPFVDGNGRLHRYLIHHVLAAAGFNPKDVFFPISSAILEKMDAYRDVLEDYSKRLLPAVEWEPTPDGNVTVKNDTADFYRFFDATLHAEFLYKCVLKTIDEDLPREIAFLRRHDRFKAAVQSVIDMPDRTADLLFRFLHQNHGTLSKRAREREFSTLTDTEVDSFEAAYAAAFPVEPTQNF